jgi:hypothetical protein
MKSAYSALLVLSLISPVMLAVSCAGPGGAMYGYYRNHPDMQERLLQLRSIYIADIQGAPNADDAETMKRALLDELGRKSRGRFELAPNTDTADAVLEIDMKEELGPVSVEEPLPFALEPERPASQTVFARMKLMDPKTKRVIYKTDTKESPDFEVNTIGKAAYTVVKNLMHEIELSKAALSQ